MTAYSNVSITSTAGVLAAETTGGAEATTAEETHHKNNFLYGDINEVIWGTVAFGIIFVLFLWKGLPAIKKLMVQRSERIAAQIAQAEADRRAAEADLASLRRDLGNADEEAARIVADARQRAEVLRADLIARAETEVNEAKLRARVEIEASKSQALADLRAEVASMTLRATEAVVSETLTPEIKSELVDQYIQQVGTSR
jgi:F-type H+-transporting ATPase subunit b